MSGLESAHVRLDLLGDNVRREVSDKTIIKARCKHANHYHAKNKLEVIYQIRGRV